VFGGTGGDTTDADESMMKYKNMFIDSTHKIENEFMNIANIQNEYSYEHVIDNNDLSRLVGVNNNEAVDIEMMDVDYMHVETTGPQIDDYYMWMLHKVMETVPDYSKDPGVVKEPSEDGDKVVNGYTNNSTFKYFNQFD
jgi:hypothetical protein